MNASHRGKDRQGYQEGCGHHGNVERAPFRLRSWWLPLSGLAALIWFLIRVIPKPSRAAYPCQRLAFPMASSFVLWVAGSLATVAIFHRASRHLHRARYALAAISAAAGLAVAWWTVSQPMAPVTAAWEPADAPNQPIGVGRGIHPGRVVWVHDPEATSWNGSSRYWWDERNTDHATVKAMLARSLRGLSGRDDDAAAWEALFRHFNQSLGRGDRGYEAGEGVAIKINQNVSSNYQPSNRPFVSPAVVHALLEQLVRRAGVTESAISVYDASRNINDPIYQLCHAEFPAVRFIDNDGQFGRIAAAPDMGVAVHYGGRGVADSGRTRLPKCVVQASYLINLALLRGHSLAGVTLCGKNHFGSVWRPGTGADRGWKPDNLHGTVSTSRPAGTYNCLVDLLGHEHLGGKTLLYMIDALYAATRQGSSTPSRWRSSPFDRDWTSSLFLSQDGVAIDSVALDFCRAEPTLTDVRGNPDNYLHEAALAAAPPSKTAYDPEGDGTPLSSSLGVHEHWNDAAKKEYSRNLGTGEGIELIHLGSAPRFRRADANVDGSVDVSDAIATLGVLFLRQGEITCQDAADSNDDGRLNISDPINTLGVLFQGRGDIPPPGKDSCGIDPTTDELGCASPRPCP